MIATILMAAGLMAAVSYSLVGRPSDTTMIANDIAAKTVAMQAAVIRTKLMQCALEYPQGNNGTAFNPAYPAGVTAQLVSGLTCPGSGVGLWSNGDGVSAPVPPGGFGNVWYYYNNASGVLITLSNASSDRYAIFPRISSILGANVTYGTAPNWITLKIL